MEYTKASDAFDKLIRLACEKFALPGKVRQRTLEEARNGAYQVTRMQYAYRFSPELAWHRLSALLDREEYQVLLAEHPENCQHVVNWALTGHWRSLEVEWVYHFTLRCLFDWIDTKSWDGKIHKLLRALCGYASSKIRDDSLAGLLLRLARWIAPYIPASVSAFCGDIGLANQIIFVIVVDVFQFLKGLRDYSPECAVKAFGDSLIRDLGSIGGGALLYAWLGIPPFCGDPISLVLFRLIPILIINTGPVVAKVWDAISTAAAALRKSLEDLIAGRGGDISIKKAISCVKEIIGDVSQGCKEGALLLLKVALGLVNGSSGRGYFLSAK